MINIFKRIYKYSKLRHKSLFLALLFSFLRSLISITELMAIALTIDSLINNNHDMTTLYIVIGLCLACILGNYITSYIEQANVLATGFFTVADMRMSAARALSQAPLGVLKGRGSKIVATLTTSLSGLENAVAMVMIGVIAGLFNSIALFIFLLFFDYRIALVMGLGMLLYLIVVAYQMSLSRKNAKYLEEAQNNLGSKALSFIAGIRVTKSYSYLEGDKDLKAAIEESKRENLALTNRSMPSQILANLIVNLFEGLILLLSMYLLIGPGLISISKAIVLIIFSFMAYASLNQAGSMLSMIGLLDEGLSEGEKIINTKSLAEGRCDLVPVKFDIECANASFSYGDNEVLHHISFKAPEHSLTAIIGPSGSGKTTLCELISRFMDLNEGSIKIGGIDIRDIKYDELMKKISIVFQNVYLFEDTILNNILFSKPNATMDEVRDACRRARCDDFIISLPNGYDTIISEGGKSLSGGERERISIARCILKDAPIIILDEPTSSLDNENERKTMEAIADLTKNKTVIMIAHKLETVRNADQIISLEDGMITEIGKHEELILNNGLYKRLLDIKREKENFTFNN